MRTVLKCCLFGLLLLPAAGCQSDSGPQFSSLPGAGIFSGVPSQWEPEVQTADRDAAAEE